MLTERSPAHRVGVKNLLKSADKAASLSLCLWSLPAIALACSSVARVRSSGLAANAGVTRQSQITKAISLTLVNRKAPCGSTQKEMLEGVAPGREL